MGGPTGAREIGPHRGGGGKREKAISPGRGGAEEEIVNAHLSLGLEIIPIVHRNYDGWTIRWSLPARRPTWDHEFESDFLQRRVCKLSVPLRTWRGRQGWPRLGALPLSPARRNASAIPPLLAGTRLLPPGLSAGRSRFSDPDGAIAGRAAVARFGGLRSSRPLATILGKSAPLGSPRR